MTLLLTLHHRNKENEPSSLNGSAPPRRRSTAINPYSQPLPFNQNERKARHSISAMTASRPSIASCPSTVKATSKASIASQINEDSPTIKRILAASGCASVAELLAKDQQKATSVSKAATNAITRASATNDSKSSATNVAKVSKSTNGSKATNGSKSTNRSKSTSNPKKKTKSKLSFFLTPSTARFQNCVTHSIFFYVYSVKWI